MACIELPSRMQNYVVAKRLAFVQYIFQTEFINDEAEDSLKFKSFYNSNIAAINEKRIH